MLSVVRWICGQSAQISVLSRKNYLANARGSSALRLTCKANPVSFPKGSKTLVCVVCVFIFEVVGAEEDLLKVSKLTAAAISMDVSVGRSRRILRAMKSTPASA